MSINLENVTIAEPKGHFTDNIMVFLFSNKQFDIEFECTVAIPTFIRWEVIYVGSATFHDYDQTLANDLVGPIEVGMNRFVLTAAPPKFSEIPPEDFNLTVVLLVAYYKDQEFIRIGYYVSNTVPEDAGENPDPSEIEREIVTEDTTVHHSQIKWN